MFVTFEAKPANKAGSKGKKFLKALCKGTGQVWVYCKTAVVNYFRDMMEQDVVYLQTGAIYKSRL